ncbi:tetratricopeptide repeat protein [Chitinivibrio alkaliphilus]|uniref:Uncharacterized protein n=1 Tax=Chitinivibrio alkaliphilus ACht1 TaxID=1313304 RepID=U7D701_9BACT|nr:tetratricopeptide repeat protein [Chitinivibrio alkaliphilus]ERP38750.1 hypothetical protein CALK_0769 [Chitinivibrio alkaliphilus ACht1]
MHKTLCVISMFVLCLAGVRELNTLSQRGQEAYETGNYAEAARIYGRAAEKDPENPRILYNKALAHTQLGEHATAAELLEKVSSLPGQEQLAGQHHFSRGVSLDKLGDHTLELLMHPTEETHELSLDDVKAQYIGALNAYAEALDHGADSSRVVHNMEITAYKLHNLPEPPESDSDGEKEPGDDDQDDDDQDDEEHPSDEGDEDDQHEDDDPTADEKDEEEHPETEQDADATQEDTLDEEELSREHAQRLIDQYSDDLMHMNKPSDTLDMQEPPDGKDW